MLISPCPAKPTIRSANFFGVGKEIILNQDNPVSACQETGLDWNVRLESLETVNSITKDGTSAKVPSKFIQSVFRNDTNDEIGAVGMSYTPLQNEDCASILEPLTTSGELILRHAASFYGGAFVSMIASMKNSIEIGPDIVSPFIFLNWSHNGQRALSATFIPYRAGSHVSLNVAIPGVPNNVSIKHTKNAMDRIERAKVILSKASSFFTRASDIFNALIASPFDQEQMEVFLDKLFPESKQAEGKKVEVMDIFMKKDQDCDLSFTRYGAFNAVCSFEDCFKPSRKTDNDENEIRFNAMVSGQSKLKTDAFRDLVSGMSIKI